MILHFHSDGRGFVVQKKGQENSSKGDEWAGIPWAEREVTTAQVTQVSFLSFLPSLSIGSLTFNRSLLPPSLYDMKL